MSQTLEPISTILTLPDEMAARRKRWTRDECRALVAEGRLEAGKFELIDGEIIHKMGQNPQHVLVVMLVLRVLTRLFGFEFVQTQGPVVVDEASEPEPDAAVVARPLSDYLSLGTPPASDVRLAVEVSDSTLREDRTIKATLYARAGISEYWIVNLPERRLEVYRAPGDAGYASRTVFAAGEAVSPLAAPDAAVAVSDLLPPPLPAA